MKVVHDWLKEYLGDDIPSAKNIEELLTFHTFEIEEVTDKFIDIDVLPNRSSDCLCHRGIARELATLLDTKLVNDPLAEKPDLLKTDKLSVSIGDADFCRRFGLTLIENVKVGPSPEWLRDRLEAIGQRSINNVVDATNYVMFALGQPLHAYDADKFKTNEAGNWQFGVRAANDGEKITVLTGEEYELNEAVNLIVNEVDGALAGIAGIKGGKYAEVDENTTTIILEAANFDGSKTRLATRALRLQTDASKRFENNVSRELGPYALKETSKLIEDIASGQLIGAYDTYPTPQKPASVTINTDRVSALIGLTFTDEQIEQILLRAGMAIESKEAGKLTVVGPFERSDINIEVDLIEEVGRIFGYDHVDAVVPDKVPLAEINAKHYYSEKIRRALLELGYSEVITSSFCKKDQIQLMNALASDKSYMRSSLIKNITETLDKNVNLTALLGVDDTRVFEIGTVFNKTDDGIAEHVSVCLGVRLKPVGYNGKEDKVLAEATKAIEDILGMAITWQIEKGVAETNLSKLLESLPQPESYEAVAVSEDVQYKPFSPYPFITRDIAMWVPEEVKPDEVAALLSEKAGDLCVRLTQFDEFTKDGRTSYGFRLIFQSFIKTLTDDEITVVMDEIYKTVAEKDWEVR